MTEADAIATQTAQMVAIATAQAGTVSAIQASLDVYSDAMTRGYALFELVIGFVVAYMVWRFIWNIALSPILGLLRGR